MRGGLRGKSAKRIVKAIRDSGEIWLTNTGPRDTSQSDYKNRFTLHDMSRLIPVYNESGYFSVEVHGGARLHQNMLNNKIDPFREVQLWASGSSRVLIQTLIRATNVWGYRMYPRNVVKLAVRSFLETVDVWRCFDFLNYVPNMAPVANAVSFVVVVLMPSARQATSSSRSASQARPIGSLRMRSVNRLVTSASATAR